jgi:hypothetical protein
MFRPLRTGYLPSVPNLPFEHGPERTPSGAQRELFPSGPEPEPPSAEGKVERLRKETAERCRQAGVQPRSRRAKTSRDERTLFDPAPTDPAVDEPQPAAAKPPSPAAPSVAAEGLDAPDPSRPEHPSLHAPIASGEKAKARDILAAVRVLKRIEQERRPAAAEERQALARFAGFGPVALSLFRDPVSGSYKDASWHALGEELQSLLTPAEQESARRSTFTAFYTSQTVITAIHGAVARLGVPGDALVLEPGCGVGNFLSLGPPEMRYIGVEMDLLSGRIARALHPDQDIRVENFRDTRLPDDSVDGVIDNVPFADLKLEYRGRRLSLHDFFLARSIDALKPGGVMALVTSHFTLDKQNALPREYLGERADFVGAIRLPSDAFKREGTAVVCDILLLRKRAGGEPANHADAVWLETAPLDLGGAAVPINRYFLNHPEQVLGTWSRTDTLYGEGYSVVGNGDLAGQLQEAIERLPEYAPAKASPAREQPAFSPPERHLTEGSFFLNHDGTICQCVGGQTIPVVYGGRTLEAGGTHTGKRLAALLRLRDLARRVLQSQNEGRPERERSEARRELNWAYDRFTFLYGPINKTTVSEAEDGSVIRRMPNLVKFREDPDAMLVLSLEEYDETTGRATKAAILQKDVVGKKPPVTFVQTAEEGLLVCLDRRGVIDLPLIAGLYGRPEGQVLAELGDLIFHDPQSSTWQTADVYLSGNVRAKLAAVLNAGTAYAPNVEALRRVQPEDVLPGDIDAHLGAPWIPQRDVQSFAADLLRVEPSAIQVGHLIQDAVWSLVADYAAQQSVAATSDYGTGRANAVWLLELALNMKTPVVYDPDPADSEKRVVNHDATLAAREKQKLIKERFRAWIFTDPDRTERLVRVYNDTYNNLRPRLFDGSHLDFPGMNKTITLRQHQRDAVWRILSSGNTLLAHVVGSGKAQPLDAKVLTPTGWASMGDLRVGDAVIAGDGTATTVTGVYPQGTKEIVRVRFSDESSTECCEEHL